MHGVPRSVDHRAASARDGGGDAHRLVRISAIVGTRDGRDGRGDRTETAPQRFLRALAEAQQAARQRLGAVRGAQGPVAVADPNAAPIANAAAEEERLKALTGGKAVVIQREKSGWMKLPGL